MSRARDFPTLNWFLLFLIPLLSLPFAARAAVDLDVKLEPGVALTLKAPQSQRFELGGAGTLKGLAGLEGGWLNVALGLTFLGLPAETGYGSSSAGTAWAPSFGFRIQFAQFFHAVMMVAERLRNALRFRQRDLPKAVRLSRRRCAPQDA